MTTPTDPPAPEIASDADPRPAPGPARSTGGGFAADDAAPAAPGAPPAAAARASSDEAEQTREAALALQDGEAPEVDLTLAPCFYLAAPGGWRSTGAVRDHRCTALDPAPAVALDKQRRLCLVAGHLACPTYVAARSARAEALAGVPAGWEPERRLVRTAPVVVEAAPRRRSLPVALGSHRLAEGAVALMALVVVVLVGSRIVGGAPPEPTPRPTPFATAVPAASGVAGAASASPASPAATVGPSAASPAATAASAAPTAKATAKPAATQRTYTVKGGDTLSGIGLKFGVAWQDIAKANRIKSPYRIVRGQVLVIPPTP